MSSTRESDEQGSALAVEPEDERLPIPMIATVAVSAAVVFAVGILWAVHLMKGVESDRAVQFGPPSPAAEVGKPEIGMVDQTLFLREARAAELREEKLRQLDSYGWVSRKNGVIHIPIEQAMKAVTEGKRPPGAGAEQPPPSPLPPVPPSTVEPGQSAGTQISPAAQPGSSTGATGGAGPNNSTPPKP
jgi:hypothetical protein